jgi:secondary thiamine-phosphate synthase enzyme
MWLQKEIRLKLENARLSPDHRRVATRTARAGRLQDRHDEYFHHAHIKSSLLGSSLNIPIADGQPRLGTWQGIYLCEHRNHGGNRRIVVTIQGE